MDGWKVYIVECNTNDLYVGVCKNIAKRIQKHNQGTACRYTRYRRPVKLIHFESCENYPEARRRERQVKKYSRAKKYALASRC